jgi:enamine deaminase RidA (YjgF/YER057c/UK114 family)
VDKAFTDELDAALACLDAALRRAGAQWADVVRLTFFVVDLPSRSLDDIRAVRDRWLVEGRLPASSIIGVAALALPELRVEVEALAVV